MTTTGTLRPPAATALLALSLLVATILTGSMTAPASADEVDFVSLDHTAPLVVPEPATAVFVGLSAMALFRRRRSRRTR